MCSMQQSKCCFCCFRRFLFHCHLRICNMRILDSNIPVFSSEFLIFLIELNQSVLCEFERVPNIDPVNLWGLLCLSPTLTRTQKGKHREKNVSRKIMLLLNAKIQKKSSWKMLNLVLDSAVRQYGKKRKSVFSLD